MTENNESNYQYIRIESISSTERDKINVGLPKILNSIYVAYIIHRTCSPHVFATDQWYIWHKKQNCLCFVHKLHASFYFFVCIILVGMFFFPFRLHSRFNTFSNLIFNSILFSLHFVYVDLISLIWYTFHIFTLDTHNPLFIQEVDSVSFCIFCVPFLEWAVLFLTNTKLTTNSQFALARG